MSMLTAVPPGTKLTYESVSGDLLEAVLGT